MRKCTCGSGRRTKIRPNGTMGFAVYKTKTKGEVKILPVQSTFPNPPYHLLFHTKYTRQMLKDKVRGRVEEIVREINIS